MNNIITTDKGHEFLIKVLNEAAEKIQEQFEILDLSTMKISIDISKNEDPKTSIKVNLSKSDEFYIENKKELRK